MSHPRSLLQTLRDVRLAEEKNCIEALTREIMVMKQAACFAADSQGFVDGNLTAKEQHAAFANAILSKNFISELAEINLMDLYKACVITSCFNDDFPDLGWMFHHAVFVLVGREFFWGCKIPLVDKVYALVSDESQRTPEFLIYKRLVEEDLNAFSKKEFSTQIDELGRMSQQAHASYVFLQKQFKAYLGYLNTRSPKGFDEKKSASSDPTLKNKVQTTTKLVCCFEMKKPTVAQEMDALQQFSHLLAEHEHVLAKKREPRKSGAGNVVAFGLLGVPAAIKAFKSKKKHGTMKFWKAEGEQLVIASHLELDKLKAKHLLCP